MTDNKDKKKSSLDSQVERIVEPRRYDSFENPEEFVVPLIQEISLGAQPPEVDLRSRESALETSKELKALNERLNLYQKKIKTLKPLLEQRKFELEIKEDFSEN